MKIIRSILSLIKRIQSLIKRAAKWYWKAVTTPLTEEEKVEMQIW